MVLWDEVKQKGGIEITTLTPVRAVRISQGRVVVVLQNTVQTYHFKLGKLTAEYETTDNLGGLCCMSHKQIAFPGRTSGQVQIVEILTGNVSIIPAHSTALRALAFSRDGELLATASDQVNFTFSISIFAAVYHTHTFSGNTHPCVQHVQLRQDL